MTDPVEEVVQLCRDLIRIDTTNTGDLATCAGERAAAEHIAGLLDEVGLVPEIHESAPGRASVVTRFEGANAIVFDAKPTRPLTVSGFVWEGNTERLLSGTAYLIDESVGSGHVILFAEEPFFRGTFRSMTRPFMNSILFNGVF